MSRLFIILLYFGSSFSLNILQQRGCFEANSLEEFYDLKADIVSFQLQEGSTLSSNKTIEKGPLSRIIELAQFNKIAHDYVVVKDEGPAHAKAFAVELHLGDEVYEGEGPSKKIAKREAATKALSQTNYKQPLYVKLENQIETPTVQLNNLGSKLGIPIEYYLVENVLGQGKKFILLTGNKVNQTDLVYLNILKNQADYKPKGPFTVKVNVADNQYFGFSHTIQGARHEAAKSAINSMNTEDNACYLEGPKSIQCKIMKDELKSPISKLYELASYHKFPIEYKIVKEYGPAHQKRFVTECKFGDVVVEGDGSGKKNSKKIAAEAMLAKIEKIGLRHSRISDEYKAKSKKFKNKNLGGKDSLVDYVDKIRNLWSSDDNVEDDSPEEGLPKNKKIKITKSPKTELIEVSKLAGIQIEFTDLGEKKGKFYSIAFLGVDPWQLCVGEGSTKEQSEATTSLYALKYLYHNMIFDKSIISDEVRSLILDENLQNSLLTEGTTLSL